MRSNLHPPKAVGTGDASVTRSFGLWKGKGGLRCGLWSLSPDEQNRAAGEVAGL